MPPPPPTHPTHIHTQTHFLNTLLCPLQVNATLFISSTATISSCTADGYCRHGDDEITDGSNRGQLRTVGTATVRLDASTQLTEDVMFAGLTPTRSSALTLFQASLLGVGVSVTAGFRVRMAGCLPGYVWQPNEAQHTTGGENCHQQSNSPNAVLGLRGKNRRNSETIFLPLVISIPETETIS